MMKTVCTSWAANWLPDFTSVKQLHWYCGCAHLLYARAKYTLRRAAAGSADTSIRKALVDF